MSVRLSSGANTSLTAQNMGLRHIKVGLGWNFPEGSESFDLDASALLVQSNGRVRDDNDLIFYNNPRDSLGSVQYHGDSLDGAGEGDDESITIDLELVPIEINKVVICVTIHEANDRNFGDVEGGYIQVSNLVNHEELVRFELSQKFPNMTALLFGELYRHNAEWKFRALGMGFEGGFHALVTSFGVQIADE